MLIASSIDAKVCIVNNYLSHWLQDKEKWKGREDMECEQRTK